MGPTQLPLGYQPLDQFFTRRREPFTLRRHLDESPFLTVGVLHTIFFHTMRGSFTESLARFGRVRLKKALARLAEPGILCISGKRKDSDR